MKIVIRLPYAFLNEHLFVIKAERSPFVQQATLFEDFVIRIVRYAFARIPASIGISRVFEAFKNSAQSLHPGRVFFSKAVALPFFRFRMLRHGYTKSPIAWREITLVRPPGQ